jgi:O-succinylbenzoic acid--CoA ligase
VYDGVPLDGVEVRIDADERIWIGGPVLFSGYLGGPPRPAGEWFRTGDLGRLEADVRLVVRGRADDVINTGGHKVVPGEVAAALQTHPGVRDAAVVGLPDDEWGELVVAVVVPEDPGDPPAPELLRLHVRQRLPRYAAPGRVVMAEAVPMLASGKHDLAQLRRELLAAGTI